MRVSKLHDGIDGIAKPDRVHTCIKRYKVVSSGSWKQRNMPTLCTTLTHHCKASPSHLKKFLNACKDANFVSGNALKALFEHYSGKVKR